MTRVIKLSFVDGVTWCVAVAKVLMRKGKWRGQHASDVVLVLVNAMSVTRGGRDASPKSSSRSAP